MGPTGQESSLRGSTPIFEGQDVGRVQFFPAKILDQGLAVGIVANHCDGQHLGAQVGQIVDSVCSAAGHKLRFTMTKNEYGGFSRDAGNFAEFKDIRNEITQDDTGLRRKLLDVFGERA
jgi:hypothetical protein